MYYSKEVFRSLATKISTKYLQSIVFMIAQSWSKKLVNSTTNQVIMHIILYFCLHATGIFTKQCGQSRNIENYCSPVHKKAPPTSHTHQRGHFSVPGENYRPASTHQSSLAASPRPLLRGKTPLNYHLINEMSIAGVQVVNSALRGAWEVMVWCVRVVIPYSVALPAIMCSWNLNIIQVMLVAH